MKPLDPDPDEIGADPKPWMEGTSSVATPNVVLLFDIRQLFLAKSLRNFNVYAFPL